MSMVPTQRQQMENLEHERNVARMEAADLRASHATLVAERDALRAEVEHERTKSAVWRKMADAYGKMWATEADSASGFLSEANYLIALHWHASSCTCQQCQRKKLWLKSYRAFLATHDAAKGAR